MSWKSDPKIRELEPYTRKHEYRYVVLFAMHDNGEECTITTYGTTRRNCDVAKIAGAQLRDLVRSGVWPDWDKAAEEDELHGADCDCESCDERRGEVSYTAEAEEQKE